LSFQCRYDSLALFRQRRPARSYALCRLWGLQGCPGSWRQVELPRLDLSGSWKAIPDKAARDNIKKSIDELRGELNRLERKLLDTRRQALASADDKQNKIEEIQRDIAQVKILLGDAGNAAGYYRTDFDDKAWSTVTVPCNFDPLGPGIDEYLGTCWFRRKITVPADWRGRRVVLHFEGVNNQSQVWVNGRRAGRTVDPWLPHDFAVHHLLKYGENNVIAVSVNNEDPVCALPTGFGWRSEGGILRPLDLRVSDWLYMEHVAITAEPQEDSGRLALEVIAVSEFDHDVVARVKTHILNEKGAVLKTFLTEAVTLRRDERNDLEAVVSLRDVTLWSPDQPYLYRARVDLQLDDKSVEQRTISFGFRSIETQGAKLLLNGQPIYLIGFNRHEDSPRTGMASDLETARSDLLDMKRMGANFVRLSHYPHDPREIDMCDEIGLLVMCEIPFNNANGLPGTGRCDYPEERELIYATCRRQMEAMIRRDRNHPSVILWSVGNECNEELPEVREINAELVTLTRRLDPSRLALHVSYRRFWSDPDLDTHSPDDMVAVNCYGYKKYGDKADVWINQSLASVHKKYPDKPILIAEFGNWEVKKSGNTIAEVGGERQARAIAYDSQYFQQPYVCGAVVWCYADHRWPPDLTLIVDEAKGAQGLSPYGVYTRDRCAGAGVPECEKFFKRMTDLYKLKSAPTK